MAMRSANDEPANPYASPLTVGGFIPEPTCGGLWREGELLVMHRLAPLPSRCIRCNTPIGEKRLRMTLHWCHPVWYSFILCNPILGLIVAAAASRLATIEVGLCDRHRRSRRRWIVGGLIQILAGCVFFFSALVVQPLPEAAPMVLAAFLLGVTGSVSAILISRPVVPQRITGSHVWLKLVSPQMLDELPPRVT